MRLGALVDISLEPHGVHKAHRPKYVEDRLPAKFGYRKTGNNQRPNGARNRRTGIDCHRPRALILRNPASVKAQYRGTQGSFAQT